MTTTTTTNGEKKKNDDDENPLLILCCTANMGNAEPTASSLEAWVPKNGAIDQVAPLNNDSDCQAKMTAAAAAASSFDIIVVGMQEATWKPKKKSKDGKMEEEEEENGDEEDGDAADEEDETETENNQASSSDPQETGTKAKPGELKKSNNKSSSMTGSFLKKMASSDDSKYMRALLQGNLGTENYTMMKEYQRGQMRLYLFVKQSLVPEITHLDVKAENTGIGRVYHNKGGIIVNFTIRQTRLSFLTAHLAAHEGDSHYQTRNADVKEILRGCKPGSKAVPKHLADVYDASLASHHMLVMGDLNYRTRVPDSDNLEHEAKVKRVLEMVKQKHFETLYSYDELSAGIHNKEVMCQFETLPCHFNPTFKMLRAEGFQYKQQRVPSYTDRILYTSADELQCNLTPLAYEPCPGFITSDHKPMRGVYAIQPNGSPPPATHHNRGVHHHEMTEPFSLEFCDLKCTDLPSMDIDGKSDPYIMFVCDPLHLVKDDRNPRDSKRPVTMKQLTNNSKHKWSCTSYKSKTLNPEWDESVKLCIPSTNTMHMNGALLYLTLMDFDLSTQDDEMCALPLNLSKLVSLEEGETKKTIQLDRPLLKYGEELGRIQCTIHVQRGGIEHYGQRHAKFGLKKLFGPCFGS